MDHRDFARTLQCLTLCLRSDSEQSCGWQVALDRAIARVRGEGAHAAAGPADSASAAAFDDALHAWSTAGRPCTEEECAECVERVRRLICAAGDSTESWKQLVLAIVRRRYHARAPVAVAAAAAAGDDELGGQRAMPSGRGGGERGVAGSRGARGGFRGRGGRGGRGGFGGTPGATGTAPCDDEAGAGDGERLLFYLAVRTLQSASLEGHELAGRAAELLCRMAPLAGGTRDVCALIEHLGTQAVTSAQQTGELAAPRGDEGVSGGRVLHALVAAFRSFLAHGDRRTNLEVAHAPLFALIGAAAEMLDADLGLVRADAAAAQRAAEKQKEEKEDDAAEMGGGGPPRNRLPREQRELMSTIHTFLPHNDRGPSGSSRRLVQSLMELMVCVCVCVCVCVYKCNNACMRACMHAPYTHACICKHTHTHAQARAHTHTHTHACMHTCR